jgi:hypothetical protein
MQQYGPSSSFFFSPRIFFCAVTEILLRNYGAKKVYGVPWGYKGLLAHASVNGCPWKVLTRETVAAIHKRGGTILGSTRLPAQQYLYLLALYFVRVMCTFVLVSKYSGVHAVASTTVLACWHTRTCLLAQKVRIQTLMSVTAGGARFWGPRGY